jgi:hypothetical protein
LTFTNGDPAVLFCDDAKKLGEGLEYFFTHR